MISHSTAHIRSVKKILKDSGVESVFDYMLVELQHWFLHHEMNVKQIKNMIARIEKAEEGESLPTCKKKELVI